MSDDDFVVIGPLGSFDEAQKLCTKLMAETILEWERALVLTPSELTELGILKLLKEVYYE